MVYLAQCYNRVCNLNTAVHMTFGGSAYGCAPTRRTCEHATDFLFFPVVCVQALDVTVSQSSVQVARGQAAILPCSFTTSAALNNLNIIWMVIPLSNANQPEQVPLKKTHTHTPMEEKKIKQTNPTTWVRVNILFKVCVYFQVFPVACGTTASDGTFLCRTAPFF